MKSEGGGCRGGFLEVTRSGLPGFLHKENVYLVFYHKGKYLIVFARGSKPLYVP